MLVLLAMVGWGGYVFYKWQTEAVAARVEYITKDISVLMQNDNLTHANLAGVMADAQIGEKAAFAAGATGNSGKMRVWFGTDQQLVDKQVAIQNFRARKLGIGKEVIKLKKSQLASDKIRYTPSIVKPIGYFDSVFRRQLKGEHIVLRYKIHRISSADTGFTTSYRYSSPAFILYFYDPKLYRLDFNVDAASVWPKLLPYFAGSAMLLALIIASYILFRRSYRIRSQMALFRESLFSNVTHELKTPLTSLQLIIESSLQQSTAPTSQQYLGYARSELDRMKLTIDKILSFGKMSSDQFELNKTMVDLDAVIKEAVNTIAMLIETSGAVVNCNNLEHVRTAGDRILLVNSIATLIDNAIKYTTGKPYIEIGLKKGDGCAVIHIRDSGIGISPVYRKKIFEPFFRIPTGDVHNVKGHGLGLSFARQVVQLHNGNIAVESDGHNGSLFTIKLPAL